MSFFTRTKLPPLQTETDLLAEIEQAYQVAKAEHIAACEALNEYRRRSDTELKRLESTERRTLRVRNERMHARAEMRKRMGLVK